MFVSFYFESLTWIVSIYFWKSHKCSACRHSFWTLNNLALILSINFQYNMSLTKTWIVRGFSVSLTERTIGSFFNHREGICSAKMRNWYFNILSFDYSCYFSKKIIFISILADRKAFSYTQLHTPIFRNTYILIRWYLSQATPISKIRAQLWLRYICGNTGVVFRHDFLQIFITVKIKFFIHRLLIVCHPFLS